MLAEMGGARIAGRRSEGREHGPAVAATAKIKLLPAQDRDPADAERKTEQALRGEAPMPPERVDGDGEHRHGGAQDGGKSGLQPQHREGQQAERDRGIQCAEQDEAGGMAAQERTDRGAQQPGQETRAAPTMRSSTSGSGPKLGAATRMNR